MVTQSVGEGATPFPGLVHFTLDPYIIMLSIKQGGIKYHFWVFGMTRPGIENPVFRTIGVHSTHLANIYIVEGNPKAPFSIATTPMCRGGR